MHLISFYIYSSRRQRQDLSNKPSFRDHDHPAADGNRYYAPFFFCFQQKQRGAFYFIILLYSNFSFAFTRTLFTVLYSILLCTCCSL